MGQDGGPGGVCRTRECGYLGGGAGCGGGGEDVERISGCGGKVSIGLVAEMSGGKGGWHGIAGWMGRLEMGGIVEVVRLCWVGLICRWPRTSVYTGGRCVATKSNSWLTPERHL